MEETRKSTSAPNGRSKDALYHKCSCTRNARPSLREVVGKSEQYPEATWISEMSVMQLRRANPEHRVEVPVRYDLKFLGSFLQDRVIYEQ